MENEKWYMKNLETSGISTIDTSSNISILPDNFSLINDEITWGHHYSDVS